MDTHLAEWNETSSLISLGFPNLAAICIQIYLHFPVQAVRDTFWDGGLLEFCRLKRLRGVRLSIFEFDPAWPNTRDPVVFFEYAAGSLPNLMDESTDGNKQLPSHQTPQEEVFAPFIESFSMALWWHLDSARYYGTSYRQLRPLLIFWIFLLVIIICGDWRGDSTKR